MATSLYDLSVPTFLQTVKPVKTGVFAPPALVGPAPFDELQAMIGKAETALDAHTPDEVNSWAGKDLDLQIGSRRPAFTSETLILSLFAAQLPFPCRHRIRHPAHADRAAGKARLRGPAAHSN
jgi:hypothetical protein